MRRSHHSRHSDHSRKALLFEHPITLALQDATFTPITSVPPFVVRLQVRVQDRLVTIRIPSLGFILPVPGYVYTSALNLPRPIWPVDPVPEGFFLPTDGTDPALVLYVFADGTIRVKALENAAIPAGNHITNALTFSYLLPCPTFRAPLNFEVSTQSMNILGTSADTQGADYGDQCSGDFVARRVAYSWVQPIPGVEPKSAQRTQMMVRTGQLDANGHLRLNDPVVAYVPPDPFLVFYTQVRIDPHRPDHLVAASTTISLTALVGLTPPEFSSAITIATSDDFGQTWTVGPGPTAGPPTQFGLFREEQSLLFDDFGNLYLSFFQFLTQLPDVNRFVSEWQLWNSTDGGHTWANLFRIASPNDQTITDLPQIAFGPDGQGGSALWYAWTDIFQFFVGPVAVGPVWAGFIPVRGKGSFGAHVEFPIASIPMNTAANVKIAVGNQGQVFLAMQQYQSNIDTASPGTESRMLLYLNPTGTRGFTASSFQPRRDIYFSNLPQNSSTDGIPIPWQPQRGIFPCGLYFFAYDPGRGRLYAVGVDRRPNFNIADNVSIFYVWTDNDGATWSDEQPVNDVPAGSRGIASLSMQPDGGLLSISFYDTRRHDPDRTTVDFFATIFDPLSGKSAVDHILREGATHVLDARHRNRHRCCHRK